MGKERPQRQRETERENGFVFKDKDLHHVDQGLGWGLDLYLWVKSENLMPFFTVFSNVRQNIFYFSSIVTLNSILIFYLYILFLIIFLNLKSL